MESNLNFYQQRQRQGGLSKHTIKYSKYSYYPFTPAAIPQTTNFMRPNQDYPEQYTKNYDESIKRTTLSKYKDKIKSDCINVNANVKVKEPSQFFNKISKTIKNSQNYQIQYSSQLQSKSLSQINSISYPSQQQQVQLLNQLQRKHNLLKESCKIQRQKNNNKNQQIIMQKKKYYKSVSQLKQLQTFLKSKKQAKQKMQSKFHQINLYLRSNKENIKNQENIIKEEVSHIEEINQKINYFKKQNQVLNEKLEELQTTKQEYEKERETNQALIQRFNELQQQKVQYQKLYEQETKQIQHLQMQVDNLTALYEQKYQKVSELKRQNSRLLQMDKNMHKNQSCIDDLQKTIRKLQLQIGAQNQRILYVNTEIYELNSKIDKEKKRMKSFHQNLKKGKELIQKMDNNASKYEVNQTQGKQYESYQFKKDKRLNNELKIKNQKPIINKQPQKHYEIIESETENAIKLQRLQKQRQKNFIQDQESPNRNNQRYKQSNVNFIQSPKKYKKQQTSNNNKMPSPRSLQKNKFSHHNTVNFSNSNNRSNELSHNQYNSLSLSKSLAKKFPSQKKEVPSLQLHRQVFKNENVNLSKQKRQPQANIKANYKQEQIESDASKDSQFLDMLINQYQNIKSKTSFSKNGQ